MNCGDGYGDGKFNNRLILLRNGQESQGFAQKAEELGGIVASMQKLGTKVYQIDLQDKESKEALVEYLQARGSNLNMQTVDQNQFILANQFNDVWFQEAELVLSF